MHRTNQPWATGTASQGKEPLSSRKASPRWLAEPEGSTVLSAEEERERAEKEAERQGGERSRAPETTEGSLGCALS